jgi:hypothetical protein
VETKDLAAAETEEEIKIDKMVCMKIQTIFVFGQIQLSQKNIFNLNFTQKSFIAIFENT